MLKRMALPIFEVEVSNTPPKHYVKICHALLSFFRADLYYSDGPRLQRKQREPKMTTSCAVMLRSYHGLGKWS